MDLRILYCFLERIHRRTRQTIKIHIGLQRQCRFGDNHAEGSRPVDRWTISSSSRRRIELRLAAHEGGFKKRVHKGAVAEEDAAQWK